jgi:hypothetical protein
MTPPKCDLCNTHHHAHQAHVFASNAVVNRVVNAVVNKPKNPDRHKDKEARKTYAHGST